MSIAPYLREIGRGKEGARALPRDKAFDLMSQLLDGRLSDVEKGGFALAMRIKGETPEELAGFMDAVLPRTLTLRAASPAIVLPSYNGARKLPNLTPLLALLLAREGVPVLVHGPGSAGPLPSSLRPLGGPGGQGPAAGAPLTDATRTTSAQVFDALGLPPVATADEAAARWAAGQPVFMAIDTLHPSLAALLSLRAVLGLRNSGHTLAKLLPALPGALRVVNHTHPEYAISLGEFLAQTQATALLMRGTEGEPVADARRLPALRCFVGGVPDDALSVEAQGGSLLAVPDLPAAIDAPTTAAFIRALLAGALPVPDPIARQVACLMALRERLPQPLS
jgi:anthranilate phosphoribosyltransferase